MTSNSKRLSRKTVSIIGQGYVGLPLALAAVDAGWRVIGVDYSESIVNRLNLGISPIQTIKNEDVKKVIESGHYLASLDYADICNSEIVIICVPTPLNDLREPDLTDLKSAAKQIGTHLRNDALVVSESTSYPGTLRNVLKPIILEASAGRDIRFRFAVAPERVNPGDKVWDQRNTPRLVSGLDFQATEEAVAFYETICDEVVQTESPEIAEAAKLLENTFRLVNISLINQFAQICESQSISVQKVIAAAKTKPYGFMPFKPGVGIGGHCIPIDPLYLTWWAKSMGENSFSLVELASNISIEMPKYIARRALRLGAITSSKPRVLIIGVAYKSGIDDVRESPAKALFSELEVLGSEVGWFDPLVNDWNGVEAKKIDWECDVAIVALNHDGLDLEEINPKCKVILDCTGDFIDFKRVISL